MDEWITTPEACKISGYHINYLRALIRRGKIEAKKFGIVWQVNQPSLMNYLSIKESQGKKRGPKTQEIGN
jgi:hypothetical protein